MVKTYIFKQLKMTLLKTVIISVLITLTPNVEAWKPDGVPPE